MTFDMASRKKQSTHLKTQGLFNSVDVVRLRGQGWTFDEIGTELGVTPQAANVAYWRAFRQAKASLPALAEAERANAMQLIDAMMIPHMPKAINGDIESGDFLLRCLDRRAKYTGAHIKEQVHPQDKPLLSPGDAKGLEGYRQLLRERLGTRIIEVEKLPQGEADLE